MRILKYVHAYMKYVYTYSSMRTQPLIHIREKKKKKKKPYIFRDLIKQTYNMRDQTSVLETLKTKLT